MIFNVLKRKNNILSAVYYLPDLFIIIFSALIYFGSINTSFSGNYFMSFVILILMIKALIHFITYNVYFKRLYSDIKKILTNFKQGKFKINPGDIIYISNDTEIIKDLLSIGKYIESLINGQQEEIDKFRELYNNVILSASSYFIVINSKNEIIFANKSFCNKFQLSINDITGSELSGVFYLGAGNFTEAIETVKTAGESAIIRQVKLLAKNKTSIIADIKVSRITVQGEIQIIIVMDDITSKYRKDYQLSLLSQITETFKSNNESDRILYAILTAVTSGSGLGFNRAMLILYDEEKEELRGSMAVGPDSYDEAVQIWGAVQSEGVNIYEIMESYGSKEQKGKKFLQSVLNTRFKMSENNILTRAFKEKRNYHIYNAYNDPQVDEAVRKFVDVNEFVIVPLIAESKVIGLIIADNKFNNNPIWNDHVDLLSIFAVQAALSIESYRNLSMVTNQMNKIQDRQNAIVESEKMAAVGRIAAHIAHEIRNPLVTMGGYAKRIIQTISKGEKSPENIEKFAKVIQQEVERLEKILSNVMDFAKPSKYIKEYNNINTVIEDTVMLLKNVLQEKKIKIVMNLMEEIPLVKSDFNQFKQVILNLMQNAMDSTPAGGEIEIETLVENNKLFIKLKDSGQGITQENLPRLFEPFFTTKVTGVGLGLATVKKTINDHDGEIYARNREEKGAEFIIELPLPE